LSFEWILFDADGTLFDYDRAESAALDSLWHAAGLQHSKELLGTYRRVNGALWKQLEAGEVTADDIKVERFSRLLSELGLEGDAQALSVDYLEHLGRQTQLLPGAEELLDAVEARYRLAMITNGLSQVQRSRLGRSPIGSRLEALVISEEVGFAKPDPRIFEAALELMGRPVRSRVLMVGDNLLADIGGAKSFGLPTCWINLAGAASSDGVGPTFEVRNLSELQRLLET
jgi:YjjG family noncanonical pyrimidine nucleotidase